MNSLYSTFQCENCGKTLNSKCNMRIKDGKFYCINCHNELFRMEEMKEKYPKVYEQMRGK